ncbi:hypothetical protein HHX38_16340 [Streptomyces sp. PKU-MA01144]|uniref:hypothetical protein n=1 Tax=Streptomyces sp. PKU-MA01144 TaxID=2729138 RepID=UPI00147FB27E|nr:hypothetical protein [Streptomyces sp. PKU-MA01144]NNJ05695.1 hypothetical protein [Streptomyces sp. PKU-MA01144]
MSRHPQDPNARGRSAEATSAEGAGSRATSGEATSIRAGEGRDPVITGWRHGDRVVRWMHGDRTVRKDFAGPTQAALAWAGRVLVVEALDDAPYTPTDNAVVYEADGTELVRLAPPRDLVAEPSWVFGFFTAHLDARGRPVLVVATQVGDFWGHPDLASGTVVDVQEWR